MELLVVIAIISILASLLLPTLQDVKESARQAVCSSNLKQFGLVIEMYTQDYKGEIKQTYDAEVNTNGGWAWWHHAMHAFGYIQPGWNDYYYTVGATIEACPTQMIDAKARGSSIVHLSYARIGNDVWDSSDGWFRGTNGYCKLYTVHRPSKQMLLIDAYVKSGSYSCSPLNSLSVSWPMLDDVEAGLDAGPVFAHDGRCGSLFVDYHVRSMTPDEITRNMMNEPDDL